MKKLIMVCLIFAMLLSLCACGEKAASGDSIQQTKPDEGTKTTTEAMQETTEDVPQGTTQTPAIDDPVESTTAATEPDVPDATEPEKKGYAQRIERPDQSIYDGPGYDYGFVGVVERKATYTIMEEKLDDEGNLWGRLKSGIGWVDLTDVRARNEAKEQVSANFADDSLLESDKYHEFILEESEYLEKLAFRCYEDVTDVKFTWLLWDGETMQVDKVLHTIPEMKAGEAFVAGVVFYGDMTMFGLSFEDGEGTTHYYSVSVSGRNGSLVFTQYTP